MISVFVAVFISFTATEKPNVSALLGAAASVSFPLSLNGFAAIPAVPAPATSFAPLIAFKLMLSRFFASIAFAVELTESPKLSGGFVKLNASEPAIERFVALFTPTDKLIAAAVASAPSVDAVAS